MYAMSEQLARARAAERVVSAQRRHRAVLLARARRADRRAARAQAAARAAAGAAHQAAMAARVAAVRD